jgi:hypothetical protein
MGQTAASAPTRRCERHARSGAYIATTLTPGISAVQFQKQLGLTRYETAFQVLHKLRAAMVNPERTPLEGEIEVDETYVGGVKAGGRGGRATSDNKVIVVGAVERRCDGTKLRPGRHFYAGRVRLRTITDAGAVVLTLFVQDHIEEGSTVFTDGWNGYNRLASRGYQHESIVEGNPRNAPKILPLTHREFSNLKTVVAGNAPRPRRAAALAVLPQRILLPAQPPLLALLGVPDRAAPRHAPRAADLRDALWRR